MRIIAVRGLGAAAVFAVVALGAGLLTCVLVSGDTIGGDEGVTLPAGVVDALGGRAEPRQVIALRALRVDVLTPRGPVNLMVSDVDFRALPTGPP